MSEVKEQPTSRNPGGDGASTGSASSIPERAAPSRAFTPSEVEGKSRDGSLGLANFSMTAVHATETQEASEISRRAWRTVMLLVLFAALAGGVIWWLRVGRNRVWQPGQTDEQFLTSLQSLPAAGLGLVSNFSFEDRITLKLQLSPQISTNDRQGQFQLRQILTEIITKFSNHRPNEELRVHAYQGEQEAGEARWRMGVSGTTSPIWFHIEGEEMEQNPEGQRPIE